MTGIYRNMTASQQRYLELTGQHSQEYNQKSLASQRESLDKEQEKLVKEYQDAQTNKTFSPEDVLKNMEINANIIQAQIQAQTQAAKDVFK